MTDKEFLKKYEDLGHAIQSGIAWQLALDHPEVADINNDANLRAHKHLRVGIDTNKADMGSLCRLLIEKGIFTETEYKEAIINGLEKEKKFYESIISNRLGRKIDLA
jgi:hypothetical protein